MSFARNNNLQETCDSGCKEHNKEHADFKLITKDNSGKNTKPCLRKTTNFNWIGGFERWWKKIQNHF